MNQSTNILIAKSQFETIPTDAIDVDLSGTKVSDIEPLEGLTKLEVLYLSDTKVSDLTPLWDLKKLKTLYLDSTKVVDLTPLAGLKNLKWLYLNGTNVSEEQINALQAELPNLAIYV